jgi:DNA-binding MarR family transcriptional regulator
VTPTLIEMLVHLTVSVLDAALAAVRDHPVTTTSIEICKRIGESQDRAKSLLRELERRGLVTRETGRGRVSWYPAEIFRQPGG